MRKEVFDFITGIISVSTPIILAVLAYYQNKVKKQINGRMDDLLRQEREKVRMEIELEQKENIIRRYVEDKDIMPIGKP